MATREDLIRRLLAAGASRDQIEQAAAENRLAMLPTELILTRDLRYTLEDAVRMTGLDEEVVVAQLVANGMVRPKRGEPVLSELNIEALKRVKRALDLGVSRETTRKIAGVFGRGIAQVADGTVDLILAELLRGAEDEVEFALRSEEVTRALRGDLAVLLEATMERHLRERLARATLSESEVETGSLPGAREVAVCFADLVGFTRVSETEAPEELGRVATDFADLAAEVAEPPVRLIKMIGDEAMLVSLEPEPLTDAAFALVDKTADEALPSLHVGLAIGPAIERGGDWYGRTVNLASRIADQAPPDSVVAPVDVGERLAARCKANPLGRVRVKGLSQPVELCQLKPGQADTQRKGEADA